MLWLLIGGGILIVFAGIVFFSHYTIQIKIYRRLYL
jgi:hypothetical protein